MTTWLDPETKAILQKTPPEKLAPADTFAFTLVLLAGQPDFSQRMIRAVRRIRLRDEADAKRCLQQPCPIIVRNGLTHADALLGQFELISCDAISVFIADIVVENATPEYLTGLYDSLLASDEFGTTLIELKSLPDDEKGAEFIDQFLDQPPSPLLKMSLTYKKARIMIHWAAKIGGEISLVED